MFMRLLISTANASNHTEYVSLSKKKKNVTLHLVVLIYILMNTVKSLTIIHLQLNQIDVLEVVILSMAYLITYVPQTIHKI